MGEVTHRRCVRKDVAHCKNSTFHPLGASKVNGIEEQVGILIQSSSDLQVMFRGCLEHRRQRKKPEDRDEAVCLLFTFGLDLLCYTKWQIVLPKRGSGVIGGSMPYGHRLGLVPNNLHARACSTTHLFFQTSIK